MLSPERAHLKDSARHMGQSYRSPYLSPSGNSFRNRAAVQLRDLTKRKGFENAYDVRDAGEARKMEEEARAIEEAINFVSPVMNQTLRKGKLFEVAQPQGGSPARDEEMLNMSSHWKSPALLIKPTTPRSQAKSRARTREKLRSLVASSEHSSHYARSATPKSYSSQGKRTGTPSHFAEKKKGSTQPLNQAQPLGSSGSSQFSDRDNFPQIDVVNDDRSDSQDSQLAVPVDDAEAQTFVATHLLFSHLMAFDSRKNTLSMLNQEAPKDVLGAKIRTKSRQLHGYGRVSPSGGGSPDASFLRGRSPNASMQRQSYQARSRDAGGRAVPDYYSSPPDQRVYLRDHAEPEIIKFA